MGSATGCIAEEIQSGKWKVRSKGAWSPRVLSRGEKRRIPYDSQCFPCIYSKADIVHGFHDVNLAADKSFTEDGKVLLKVPNLKYRLHPFRFAHFN